MPLLLSPQQVNAQHVCDLPKLIEPTQLHSTPPEFNINKVKFEKLDSPGDDNILDIQSLLSQQKLLSPRATKRKSINGTMKIKPVTSYFSPLSALRRKKKQNTITTNAQLGIVFVLQVRKLWKEYLCRLHCQVSNFIKKKKALIQKEEGRRS